MSQDKLENVYKRKWEELYSNEIASVDLTNLINIKQKVSIIFLLRTVFEIDICPENSSL